jgi:transposase
LEDVKKDNPKAIVRAWAFDEHRIGLKPVFRRIWALEGQRPIVEVHHRFKWSYLYGYVCPENGETHWNILPYVCVEELSLSLADFASCQNIGENNHAVIAVDNAGWHTSLDLIIPDGIHLVFLPPYTPQMQPAEKLWPLTNEGVANRNFKNIEDLEQIQGARCIELSKNVDLIKSTTEFHWWPSSKNS